jgi:hypothetical protein
MVLVEWHDHDPNSGVLEVHESMTAPGPALELQLFRARGGRLVAFWVTAKGEDLGMAEVGMA